MAALTGKAAEIKWGEPGSQPFLVATGDVIYRGALVGFDVSTGTVFAWHADNNLRIMGIAIGVDANTTHSVTGDGTKKVVVATGGLTLRNIAVAGVNVQTESGDEVFCSTDNFEDISVTDPTTSPPIGRVVNVDITNGKGDVMLYPAWYGFFVT